MVAISCPLQCERSRLAGGWVLVMPLLIEETIDLVDDKALVVVMMPVCRVEGVDLLLLRSCTVSSGGRVWGTE